MHVESFSDSLYMSSIIFKAQNLSESHEIRCALPVRHLSANTDEVILLYLEVFLIM